MPQLTAAEARALVAAATDSAPVNVLVDKALKMVASAAANGSRGASVDVDALPTHRELAERRLAELATP